MRKLHFLFILLLCAVSVRAADVTTTAGKLSSKVTDLNVTSLKINGTLDARDFMFISDKLEKLTQIDLSGASIVAYDGVHDALVNGQVYFPADEIPQVSFFGKKLTSVTLPSSLKSIGFAAFAGCTQLKTINLPSKLALIGSYAFSGSGLQSVKTGTALKTVGPGAFSRCVSLTTVDIQPAVIDNFAFLGCTALTSVTIGAAIERVGISAFNGCSALNYIQMRSPAKLQCIDAEAFVLSGLQEFNMLSMKSLQQIGDYAFLNLKEIRSLTIPADVSYIGTRAMMGMKGLQTIVAKPTTPPALGEAVWQDVNQQDVELLVKNIDDYRAAAQWRDFMIYEALLLGDVNGDGVVNVSDVTALINHILGIPDTFVEKAADVLGDGRINVSDVTALVNLILSGTEVVIRRAGVVTTDDIVTIDNFAIAPDQVKTVELKLSNQTEYAAMQCDVILPPGLTIVSTDMSKTSRTAEHVIVSKLNDNACRIIAYSMNNDVMSGHEGPVLRLQVRGSQELATDAEIVIDNVIFATDRSKTFYAPATTTRVSNATGIDDMMADNDRVYARGSMLVIETSRGGVAQLVQMNGMVQDLQVSEGHNEFEVPSGFVIVRLNGKSYKLAVK